MTIQAALLDSPAASGTGLFVRIDTLDSARDLTDHHVASVSECDLPPNAYVWIPNSPRDPNIGAFWPVDYIARSLRAAKEAERSIRKAQKREQDMRNRKAQGVTRATSQPPTSTRETTADTGKVRR